MSKTTKATAEAPAKAKSDKPAARHRATAAQGAVHEAAEVIPNAARPEDSRFGIGVAVPTSVPSDPVVTPQSTETKKALPDGQLITVPGVTDRAADDLQVASVIPSAAHPVGVRFEPTLLNPPTDGIPVGTHLQASVPSGPLSKSGAPEVLNLIQTPAGYPGAVDALPADEREEYEAFLAFKQERATKRGAKATVHEVHAVVPDAADPGSRGRLEPTVINPPTGTSRDAFPRNAVAGGETLTTFATNPGPENQLGGIWLHKGLGFTGEERLAGFDGGAHSTSDKEVIAALREYAKKFGQIHEVK